MRAPAALPFLTEPRLPSARTPDGFTPAQWPLVVCWPLYGIALMLPWLGTYSLASMVPNKLVVAGSGLMMSVGLRVVYQRAERHHLSPAQLVAVVCVASVVAGLLWDAVLSAALGRSVHFDTSHFGALGAGIPQLAGGLYDAVILATWSMAYFLLQRARAESPDARVPATAMPPSTPAGAERLVLRDGKRAVVLAAGEIDWVEAEGDYVRVHAGSRRLLLRATMSRTEAVLPPNEYVRIHRSAIVRVARVCELIPKPNNELEVVLRDGTRLRASRSYVEKLRAAFGV